MAEKQEMFTFPIDLNLNAFHAKFRDEVLQHIDVHNQWFQETLDAIEQKVKNRQSVVSELHVKTPRQRKRKTVLSTAKKLVDGATANKKQKKRRTVRPSVVKHTSSSSDAEVKENDEISQQPINRELFCDMDVDDVKSSPVEAKWRMKQYTRASRATFRKTMVKDKPEDEKEQPLKAALRETIVIDKEEVNEVEQPEKQRRVTRAMRSMLCQQKSDGSSSENDKRTIESTNEHTKKSTTDSDVDGEPEKAGSISFIRLDNHSASTPKASVEVIDVVTNNPEKFVTPLATPPKNVRKDSENEWMTDDESFHEVVSTPSQQVKKVILTTKKQSMNRKSIQKLARTQIPTTTRMTRAQTRLQVQDKVLTRSMQKNVVESGGNQNTSSGGSSAKSTRSVSRLKLQGSAVKGLTESAAKRREEDRQRRIIQLQKSVEKESKVLEKKEKFIQQRVMEHKMRREEKLKRVQETREQIEKEKEEKRRQELERKEEIERRYKQREETKRARLAERQQALAAKVAETEQRKIREEKERIEKIQKLEELNKKKEEEMMKRKQEEERLAALCQQHNNSLQQKAMANSFLKKTAENPKISPPVAKSVMDKTYTMGQESGDCVGYQITPPPKAIKKPPNPEDYDITDIKSDDDTDDERKPKKPIPNWAKGSQFIQALNEYFGRPVKYRERVIRKLYNKVVFPVDLGDIFQGHRPVASRYAKRTSSAIWNSPPMKMANVSMSFSTDTSQISDGQH